MVRRGALVVGAFALALWGASPASAAAPKQFWTNAKTQEVTPRHSFLRRVVKRAMPAVVSITTTDKPNANADPKAPAVQAQRGVGSGFVISPDGYILTCSHVIEGALDVHVTLVSREGYPEEYPARVVGNDPQTDFALLKIDAPRRFPVLRLGSASSVDVADWVVVIGSPFGLANSVSIGVVSYKGRSDVTPAGRNGAFEYLQTDASINPGNSGGPILDAHGDVVAIANAVNVAGQGIGFAVPVDVAKAVLPDLKAHGRLRHGWLGIAVQDLTPELARSLGMTAYSGAFVREVSAGGPAALAGIRQGDVITRLSGSAVHRAAELRLQLETATVGHSLGLSVARAEGAVRVDVRLADTPKIQVAENGLSPALHVAATSTEEPSLGARARAVDSGASERAGLARPFGALIVTVEPQSPLARAGLKPGDVVLKVNDTEVANPRQFSEALDGLQSGTPAQLFVRRDAATLGLTLKK